MGTVTPIRPCPKCAHLGNKPGCDPDYPNWDNSYTPCPACNGTGRAPIRKCPETEVGYYKAMWANILGQEAEEGNGRAYARALGFYQR